MNRNSDSYEIKITELLRTSRKLSPKIFLVNDFYSLLALALVSVYEYSRPRIHLNPEDKIDLAINFIPDLLTMLENELIITKKEKMVLLNEYEEEKKNIPRIMRAYIYASGGLRIKLNVEKKKEKNKCLIS